MEGQRAREALRDAAQPITRCGFVVAAEERERVGTRHRAAPQACLHHTSRETGELPLAGGEGWRAAASGCREIDQARLAVAIDQHVAQIEIAVEHAPAMHRADRGAGGGEHRATSYPLRRRCEPRREIGTTLAVLARGLDAAVTRQVSRALDARRHQARDVAAGGADRGGGLDLAIDPSGRCESAEQPTDRAAADESLDEEFDLEPRDGDAREIPPPAADRAARLAESIERTRRVRPRREQRRAGRSPQQQPLPAGVARPVVARDGALRSAIRRQSVVHGGIVAWIAHTFRREAASGVAAVAPWRPGAGTEAAARQNAGVTERVLFIRLSALGDVVNTLPALAALRAARPDVAIDWVVDDRFAGVLAEVEGIAEVIPYPRTALRRPTPGALFALLRHVRRLRSERYAAAIDFQGNLKGALQLRTARSQRAIGASAAREGVHRFYRERVPVSRDLHRAQRALALLAPLGVDPCESDPFATHLPRRLLPTFRIDAEAAMRVDGALGGRDPKRPLVLLHPGTSKFGAFKRWPAEHFAAAARALVAERGIDVSVTCGPGEEALARGIVAAAEGVAFVPPVGGLEGLVELLRRATVFVAADSGPLHLAAALDVRTVGLFGPKDPTIYAPPWEHATIVRQAPPCAPCSLRRCDDPICMTRLPEAAVIAAVRAQLAAAHP
jgi:heptosyltransferase-1